MAQASRAAGAQVVVGVWHRVAPNMCLLHYIFVTHHKQTEIHTALYPLTGFIPPRRVDVAVRHRMAAEKVDSQ